VVGFVGLTSGGNLTADMAVGDAAELRVRQTTLTTCGHGLIGVDAHRQRAKTSATCNGHHGGDDHRS
jgi:hypothetical protein